MLLQEEKNILKSRISSSVNRYKKRKKRQKLAVVFSLISICLITLYPHLNFGSQKESFQKYVQTSDFNIKNESEDVTLVLGDQKEICISEPFSNIAYSDSGKTLMINETEKEVSTTTDVAFNTILVPFGKRTMITLFEGTKVWLNSGSKLVYPNTFDKDKREVYLEGEAIFDVSHNPKRPFFVLTKDYDVKVLGTVFNVCSYKEDEYTSTALQRGSVEIQYEGRSIFGKSKLKIKPGTLAVYHSKLKKLSQKKTDVNKYMSWRDGKLILKKSPLQHIIKKLSRFYNQEIILENEELARQTFSGHLDLKDNLQEVLTIIKQTSDIRYRMESEKIIIN